MSKQTEIWKKASEVFAEISELSPQQALAHVYGINNITLDVREAIITLINAGSQASQFFKDEISPNFNTGINNPQSYQIGQQLDEYELTEELGSGGMSQVFKAKRINSEQQTYVAIKIFAPKDNSNELLNHFLNEQKILAELSHPHIVKMLHSGKTEDNITYLVMELIEKAQALDVFCQSHQLNTHQKISFIAQCADALSYSHANLIIHRDLKPDNILVNKDKQLKIVDFGIAKLINNDVSGNKTTIMALTPSYAAPEQINSQTISVKTDIFSLAVVALDLLTDASPLPKDRLLKSCANDEEYLDKLLGKLKLDKDLKNILNKALQQEPNKRYSSMQSFADDINNWLNNKPVNATSQSFVYRVQKFAKRRSALFATMISFMTFMIIGSIIGYNQYQQIKIEAQKANTVKQFMLDSYTQTNPDSTQGRRILAKDLLETSAQTLSNDTKFVPEVQFELLQTLGIAFGALGEDEKAANLLKQSLDIKPNDSHSLSYYTLYSYNLKNGGGDAFKKFLSTVREDKITNKSDRARILRVMAQINSRKSNFDEAAKQLQMAINLSKDDKNITDETLSQRLLAEMYYLQSKPKKAIEYINNLLSDTSKNIPLSLQIGLNSDLGTLYNDIGEYKKALKVLRKTSEQIRQVYGNKDIELSKMLNQLSGAHRQLGNLQQAQKYANESYQINREVLGENNTRTAASINTLGVLAYQAGDIPKAIEYMQQAVAVFENQESEDYADTLELKTNLAALLGLANRNDEALNVIQEVFTTQKQKLGLTHDSTIYSQQIYARTLAKVGQLPLAMENAEIAEKNAQQHLGLKNPLTVGAMYTLAGIYKQNKQYQKALPIMVRIIEEKLLPETHPKYKAVIKSIEEINKLLN